MVVCRSLSELRLALGGWSGLVGFVPTMGAFHEGHLELMRRAKADCGFVVVSLFVNPLQFGPSEDLSKYPRREGEDFLMAEGVGADVMFCPGYEFVEGVETVVRVGGVSSKFEGESRPGHFEGVATIVAKLFHAVGVCRAYFGLKDLQQCAVVGAMVRDLGFPVDLEFVETVREASGLAMSSRNDYFTAEQRAEAGGLYRVLRRVSGAIVGGGDVAPSCGSGRAELEHLGFEVEYLDLVDSRRMESSDLVDEWSRLVVAARFCGVRLIDNISLDLTERG